MWADVCHLLVALLLLAWLLVTAASALPRIGTAVRRRTPGWCAPLVPSWNFFAPRPAVLDRVLLYRDVPGSGAPGPLREVWPGSARFAGARVDKAVSDAASHLLTLVTKGGETGPSLMVSVPYLMLLGRAAAQPHDVRAVGFQFVIAMSSLREDEEPDVVFTSAVHRLESA